MNFYYTGEELAAIVKMQELLTNHFQPQNNDATPDEIKFFDTNGEELGQITYKNDTWVFVPNKSR